MGNERGFTLIELLIVVAIIGILAAVAVPGYIGMQERGRKGAIMRVAEANIPELQGWINSTKRGATATGTGLLIEVDTNGDGSVPSGDLNNNALATVGVVTTWTTLHAGHIADPSPWGNGALWIDGGPAADLPACVTVAVANPGAITLCYTPAEDSTVNSIFVVATDNAAAPGVIFSKAVSAE